MTTDYSSKIKIEGTEILMRPDGIVQISTADRSYNESDIRAVHTAISNLTNGKKVLSLLIPHPYTNIENDARHFLSTPEAGIPFIAKAYVIKSLSHRIIGNFIIRFRKYSLPVKFFKEVEPALEWLKTFSPENEKEPNGGH
ncbi:MAG: hypothetical protein JWO32_2321 [Bacteroidetes bacterium]|nr:hypothetical protein [Bacteroidota bacterium]